ncbi:hypothetical protein [Okeania sp. SIO3I5]|nr:hypothetical protein [Okeania sp. SIO3I5]
MERSLLFYLGERSLLLSMFEIGSGIQINSSLPELDVEFSTTT